MKPINQYTDAKQLMKELFDIGKMLQGTGVNITPLTDIMNETYGNYILPVEWEEAQKEEKKLKTFGSS